MLFAFRIRLSAVFVSTLMTLCFSRITALFNCCSLYAGFKQRLCIFHIQQEIDLFNALTRCHFFVFQVLIRVVHNVKSFFLSVKNHDCQNNVV